ncbi:MAG: glycosyltransferase family 1 protein [Bacteroidetes bacterium]|nr:MAG: glycosyltransferase family 1 protein [Bacteroidota bacterium]
MAPTRIAVNTRLLLPGRMEGIARFAWEVLSRLAREHPEVEFHWLFDRPFDPALIPSGNVVPHVVFPQARHPLLWHLWFHYQLPRLFDRIGADLFFSPEFYLSSHPRIPQIPVFHDLAYEHYPDAIAPWASHYVRKYSPRYARAATHILTVSEFSKQDIVSRYHIDPEKVTVVYNGAGSQFAPLATEQKQAVRAQYTGGRPYVLFVGAQHPRKNLPNLLRAFELAAAALPEISLLLVGREGWQNEEARQVFEQMQARERVRFSGFLPDEDLVRAYAAAEALVYIPWLEGFGIPLLEAMRSDTPVICSNSSSMPEVAGKAALLVNPHDPQEVASAMIRLLNSDVLREKLVAEGRIQRERFSWEDTTRRVWEVIARL